MPLSQNSPLLSMFEPISRQKSHLRALATTISLDKSKSLSSSKRRKLPLNLGLSVSFFSSFTFWLILKKGTRTRHPTIFDIMNIREFQLSWQKGFVNIYGNRWTCLISFFPPYLIQPPYQAGSDQLTLVFVPFLLFQSISWNHLLILQRSSTLDFLLIVTCKSNKYKRRVQNMSFL